MAIVYEFDEYWLDPKLFEKVTSTLEYANSETENEASGVGCVNVWRLDARTILDLDARLLSSKMVAYLKQVFRGGHGSAVGLRVRVPDDYFVEGEAFAVADGVKTVYPLIITYRRPGINRGDARRIIKPVVTAAREKEGRQLKMPDGENNRAPEIPFKLYHGLVEFTGDYKVDMTRGEVVYTNDSKPANGVNLSVTMEYDTPMRFAGNNLGIELDVNSKTSRLQWKEIYPAELGIHD